MAGYEFNTVYDIGANDGRWYNKWKSVINPDALYCLFEANPNQVAPNLSVKYFNCVLSDKSGKSVKYYIGDTTSVRKGVFNQMDVVFVRKDILATLHNYNERYTGF